MHQRSQRASVAYPIDEYKAHLLYLLEKRQVLIVVGETGSGKSTRIPQFIVSAGIYNRFDDGNTDGHPKQICVTQPRRVAAIQLAHRVANDLKCDVGTAVGYAIRFKDLTDPQQTMIKYVTEGLLIREMMSDPLLQRYSVIIIDEVHERNLNTDTLLGLLKCILIKRKDLKLIVCSATPNIDLFRKFFSYQFKNPDQRNLINNEPAILHTRGKRYPLKIFYKDQPVPDYLEASIGTVKDIHETSRLASGKILVFLTGQDEVDYVCNRLNDYSLTISKRLDLQQLLVLPLYASLKPEEISKAFDEHGRTTRVCIVATNVAETSLTISGIAYVIDCGFVKLRIHDCKTGIDALIRVPISKSSAKQRAGRTGRTREGIVYRLYSHSHYDKLNEDTTPEIQRSPLMETVIMLKALGVDDVSKFPLISKMPKDNLVAALELLYALQAIDEQGSLTGAGLIMATFNLDPRISKMLVSLESAACTQEACKIAAVLQVKEIFTKSGRRAEELWSNANLVNLCAEEGDIISYLNILNSFLHNQKSQKYAEKRNLNYHALLDAVEIADKLEALLRRAGLSLTSSLGRTDVVRRSVVSGLFPNAAYLHASGTYKTIKGDQTIYIHPTSVFSKVIDRPKLVVFAEILSTNKLYMRHIMSTERDMLLNAAPHYYNFSTSLEMMRKKL